MGREMKSPVVSHHPSGTRKYRVTVGISVFLIVVGCSFGVLVPAGLGWDFANFYDAGRIVAAGELDLLLKTDRAFIAAAPVQGALDFWGTPLSAYLYVPLSWFPPALALMLFKAQNVLAYGAALAVLFMHVRQFADQDDDAQWQFAAMYAVLALLYQPFWTVFRVGGQTTATVLLLLVLALLAHSRLRFGWSAFLFVAAVMIKPALVTALVFLMIVSNRPFALYALLHLGILGLVSIALMGWDLQLEFVSKMLGGASRSAPWYHNSSLSTLVTAWRQGTSVPAPSSVLVGFLLGVLKLGVTGTLGWIFLKNRTRFPTTETRSHFGFLLALLFFLLISQTVWEHYLAVLFIPIVFLVASFRHLDMTARWLMAGIVVTLPLQNLIAIQLLQSWVSFDTAWTLAPVIVAKTAPLWIAWLVVWRYHGDMIASYRAVSAKAEPAIRGMQA
jgi:hypothetical protein